MYRVCIYIRGNLMSINEVKSIQAINNYVIENLDSESQQAAKKVETLFSEKFYNGGSESASAIAVEIEKLESYLTKKQNEYNQTYNLLKLTNEELNKLNQELEKEILDVTQKAEEDEYKQRVFIQRAIDETNEQYMKGEIEKDDMPGVLAGKIAKYCEIDPAILTASNKLNSTKSRIATLTNKIASIIDRVNCLETESKLAQGTLVMMKNLMGKMNLGTSDSRTTDNEAPVYTPTKQALVDELAQGIKGLTGEGTYDKNSISNPQVAKLREFLGLNGNKELNDKGVLKDSALNKMKDAGFSEKEAIYAINWIFDKANMSYQPGGQWSVPYGHGTEAQETYKTLLEQTKALWGADGKQETEAVNPTTTTTTPTNNEPTNTTTTTSPTNNVKRTDPIGYSFGDVTYEFIIDRNNDGKFNNTNEFLGAKNGIDELKALDLNKDGTIDKDELNANENIFVLMTDHRNGTHGFMSAAKEIDSIDLNSISSKSWTNINNNNLRNAFTVNTVKGTAQGYQTDDDNYYLSKSYNGVQNADMQVTIDDEALKKAQNIFDSIQTLSDEESKNIEAKAGIDVKKAQASVNKTDEEMKANANEADSGLTRVDRPETKEEALIREQEEAKKAEEEEKAQAEKNAAKAEEEEKNKKEKNIK